MTEGQPLSDEEAIAQIAAAMKDNAPTPDEKHNVHTFLTKAVQELDTIKVAKLGNLRDDKEMNELGMPTWNVRGSFEMGRISDKIMGNTFFKDFFDLSATETLATSLSREGFMIRQASTTTKQVADVTKRRKVNKGMFRKTEETSGGDTTGSAGSNVQ